MKVIIQPSSVKGIIQAPASKSSMQRACAAAYLKGGECHLLNAGYSNDDRAALQIIRDLGADVTVIQPERLVIIKKGDTAKKERINCGESGLSVRMFIPIISLYDQPFTVVGEGSLQNRPMDSFDTVLPQLGVRVSSNEGKLPLIIRGPLLPKNIEIDGSLSSQFLTGLLMAYAGAKAENVSIFVNDLKSKPYIDLTLDILKHFGLANVENRDYKEFFFHPHNSSVVSTNYKVEADWSGGAFLLVSGAIAGPVTVKGLDLGSTQADKAIVEILMRAQASISMDAKGIQVRPATMHAFDADATDCPDLFPPLVVLAAFCSGVSRIKGVNRLIHKESNRALSLQEEFAKMGVTIETDNDHMLIHGGGVVTGATVRSHHDHRIAMALTVAALKANSETILEEAGSVKKSYPDFFNDLKSIGADVSLPQQQYNL